MSIRIECERCGATVLVEGVSCPERYSEVTLAVAPCEGCLEEARHEAIYADELAAGIPEGVLPADVKNLRKANAALADTVRRAEPIIAERDRQDAKWGPQNHSLPVWVTILMEEVGELAAAVLCHRFGNDKHPELDWRKEAIQVAAVALAMIEQYREAAEAAKEK